MKVLAFYSPLPELSQERQDDCTSLIDLWRYSWKSNGYDPILVDLSQASLHSDYEALDNPDSPLYTHSKNSFSYLRLCYRRWMAYEVISRKEACLWADFDVINYGLRSHEFSEKNLTQLQFFARSGCFGFTGGVANPALDSNNDHDSHHSFSAVRLDKVIGNFVQISLCTDKGQDLLQQVISEAKGEVNDMTISAVLLKEYYSSNPDPRFTAYDHGRSDACKSQPIVHYDHGFTPVPRTQYILTVRPPMFYPPHLAYSKDGVIYQHISSVIDDASSTRKLYIYDKFLSAYQNLSVRILIINRSRSPGELTYLTQWLSNYFSHEGASFTVLNYLSSDVDSADRRLTIYNIDPSQSPQIGLFVPWPNKLDIVIDQGGLDSSLSLELYRLAFPCVEDHGLYFVEDSGFPYLQRSHDTDSGSYADHSQCIKGSFETFSIELIRNINYGFIPSGKQANKSDLHTIAVHHFPNLILIEKGLNIQDNDLLPSRIPYGGHLFSPLNTTLLKSRTERVGTLIAHIANYGDVFNAKGPYVLIPQTLYDEKKMAIQGFRFTLDSGLKAKSRMPKLRAFFGSTIGFGEIQDPDEFIGTKGRSLDLYGIEVVPSRDDLNDLEILAYFANGTKLSSRIANPITSDSPMIGIEFCLHV